MRTRPRLLRPLALVLLALVGPALLPPVAGFHDPSGPVLLHHEREGAGWAAAKVFLDGTRAILDIDGSVAGNGIGAVVVYDEAGAVRTYAFVGNVRRDWDGDRIEASAPGLTLRQPLGEPPEPPSRRLAVGFWLNDPTVSSAQLPPGVYRVLFWMGGPVERWNLTFRAGGASAVLGFDDGDEAFSYTERDFTGGAHVVVRAAGAGTATHLGRRFALESPGPLYAYADGQGLAVTTPAGERKACPCGFMGVRHGRDDGSLAGTYSFELDRANAAQLIGVRPRFP